MEKSRGMDIIADRAFYVLVTLRFAPFGLDVPCKLATVITAQLMIRDNVP
jgi:hypothetical protein